MNEPPRSRAPTAAIAAWCLFDWAAQPFFTLVATFIFAPFFVTMLAPDPDQGQAMWGFATGAAGFAIALLSPPLGAIADAAGARKPWIAAFGLMLVAGCMSLWFAAPGATLTVAIALGAFIIGTIGAEFATVFNNAMMPGLVPAERLGRLSGTGWALGYLGGLISLGLALAFIVASAESGRTLAGLVPLFGLDPAMGEGQRLIGPLSALWFILFVAPMMLLVPDAPRRLPLERAVGAGLRALRHNLAALAKDAPLRGFLIANLLYTDGLTAVFTFGGIYAAGSFGWGSLETGVFGIIITIAATVGAFVGGRLDDRRGPKLVLTGALIVLILAVLGILSITAERVFFFVAVAPPAPGDGLFASISERVYLGFGVAIGLVAGPLQAASRTLLARLAPPDRLGQAFGLLALSGKVTAFVGPVLVATATTVFASQRAGVVPIVLMLAAGLFVLRAVVVSSPRA